jgi:hypothetical protein
MSSPQGDFFDSENWRQNGKRVQYKYYQVPIKNTCYVTLSYTYINRLIDDVLRTWFSVSVWLAKLLSHDKIISDIINTLHILYRGQRGCDRMVVGFTTTYTISAYRDWCCQFKSRSGRGVQHYMIKFVNDLWQDGGFLRVLRYIMQFSMTSISIYSQSQIKRNHT